MAFRCNDCGGPIGDRNRSTRSDVCDACWDLRGRFIEARSTGQVDAVEFVRVQRMLAGRSTGGADEMRRLLGED